MEYITTMSGPEPTVRTARTSTSVAEVSPRTRNALGIGRIPSRRQPRARRLLGSRLLEERVVGPGRKGEGRAAPEATGPT